MTSNTEIAEDTPAATGKESKRPKKGNVGARGAHVAPAKGKSGKKAKPAKKAPKAPPKPKVAPAAKSANEKGARGGSKTAQILDLLKRPGGVSSKELMKITGWQPHSVRGFLSGTVGKKMGLTVVSANAEDGERNYSIEV